jgi:hypothetical protein
MGRYVTLEPLDAARRAGELFEASHGSEAALHIWDYLSWGPWKSPAAGCDVSELGPRMSACGTSATSITVARVSAIGGIAEVRR